MTLPRCPFAEWRPIGAGRPIIPRVLIFHTMSGYLAGTEATFKHDGVCSTFGVGGPWDGAALDGVVWQWRALDQEAPAQWDGNAYADSVETSDGGDHTHPWSQKQCLALASLGAWWCKVTGSPARMVSDMGQAGIGFHQQFSQWNRSGHDCPGVVRHNQLVHDIIPAIATLVGGPGPGPRRSLDMILVHPPGAAVYLVFGPGSYLPIEDPDDRDRIKASGVPYIELTQTTWDIWKKAA